MKEFLNILLLLILGIVYVVSFTKVISSFLNKIVQQRNNAIIALYLAAIGSAGVILIDISKIITDAFIFFFEAGNIGKSIGYTALFFIGAWVYSLAQFHLSFFLVSLLSKENEKIQLNNNNIEIALVHGIVLIILSFLVGPALSTFASSFIPYPELPF